MTDALRSGWGATWGPWNLSGSWKALVQNHINALEMRAILEAVWVWAPELWGAVVVIHCDNRSAVSYLLREGGTCSPRLMQLARELILFADRWHLQLRSCYLPGIANLEADALSRRKAVVEWCLHPEVAQEVSRCLGRPSIDLFASQANALLRRFFSIHHSDQRALGFDALHQPWTELLTYTFPPPHLILLVLAKLARSPTVLLLVTPWWSDTALFWETVFLFFFCSSPRVVGAA